MNSTIALRQVPSTPWEKLWARITGPRRYDLPLHRGSGGLLLTWIIGVMTYLVCLFMMIVFLLSAIQHHWQQGLEGHYTIEIPHDAMQAAPASRIDDLVRNLNNLSSVNAHRLTDAEIAKLVEPWLGDSAMIAELPLPSLIAIDRTAVNKKNTASIDQINNILQRDLPQGRLDTHQEWLAKWIQLTQAARMIILTMALILALTAALTVAGTAKTRLALHRDEVDLLHLIGATDHYIATQFQRQAFRIAAEGAAAGMIAAFITLGIVSVIKGQTPSQLLPHFNMNGLQWFFLVLTPLLAGAIAMLASRLTVVHALEELP